MSLCKLLHNASPAKPTYVLATVQADFKAKDGSSELSVRLGDDVYLMFSIDGWAFATDLRDGKRRGYVPLNFCKAVEDFYVPAGEAEAGAAAIAVKRQLQEPTSRHLVQPSEPAAVVKTCRIRNLSDRSSSSGGGRNGSSSGSSSPFDTVSCSSLEVSEIEADAESPCPLVCSPSLGSISGDGGLGHCLASPTNGQCGAAAAAAALSPLVTRLGGLSISEYSAFRRPATVAGCEGVAAAPSPDADISNCGRCSGPRPQLRQQALAAAGRYTKSTSSRLARPRFLSVDAGVTNAPATAAAAAKDRSGWSPIRPLPADSKDSGSGRQSTSDEGYNSLVKYADTDAWRELRCGSSSSCAGTEDGQCDAAALLHDNDCYNGGDDALSLSYSTDYDSL